MDDDVALSSVVDEVGDGPFALDTEADSYHHYRDKVCLIQLSYAGRDVLVDPLARLELGPLRAKLEDRSVLKVLHGADYDVRILHRDFGMALRGLFDTMTAARLCGERAFGLAALLQRHLGVELDKRHQLADWSRRPLPGDLRAYAAADTRHLLELRDRLEAILHRLGRTTWAEEEFQRAESVRWTAKGDDPEAFRRVKGSSGLSRKELAVLKEVHAWREDEARRRDVPAFRVARDAALVTLARAAPSTSAELAGVRGIPDRIGRGPRAAGLVGRVRRALALPESAWPESQSSRPRQSAPGAHLESLRRRRDVLARELDLEPWLIASRSVLEAIAQRVERGEDWRGVPELRSWQAKLLAGALG